MFGYGRVQNKEAHVSTTHQKSKSNESHGSQYYLETLDDWVKMCAQPRPARHIPQAPKSQVTICKGMQTNDIKVESCISQVMEGFRQEITPSLTSEGTSGAYIIKNDNGSVAVFKPIDEEPFAPHNPRDMQGLFGSETCRAGVKSGESTLREVAAYLLDDQGFSGVPATSLVEIRHESLPAIQITEDQVTSEEHFKLLSEVLPLKRSKKCFDMDSISEEDVSEHSFSTFNSEETYESQTLPKVGSLQSFIKSEGPIENFSSDLFSADEIHKIAVLDMRIFNLDRNTENILVQKFGDN
jgi:hypothetical protein